jgi:hypothetical protein
MHIRGLIGAIILAALAMPVGGANAFDDSKYPNLKGQWNRVIFPGLGGQPSFDQTKPWGYGQQAPLTAEYKAVMDASLADQAKGGQGNFTGYGCRPFGMPLMMIAFYPQEYVITPETTYILVNNADHGRRIFTDGRDWPTNERDPTYQGYSIGKWLDEDGDGKYDVLEIETRGPFKGPRVYDASGLPLAYDNLSVFKERLTRPWTVDKRYRRTADPRPDWPEYACGEENLHVQVGKENYFVSGDGFLMPARKDQLPPDLRYFKQSGK